MRRFALPLSVILAAACGDVEDDHGHDHENEVITTVVLTWTPAGGGAAVETVWEDPEDDGSPVIDPIVLDQGTTWTVDVRFLNALEEPAEDITAEVEDESDQHQIFFTGSAVEGPATGENAAAVLQHAYADEDAGGLPVGLSNTIEAILAGTGDLIVTLRHMPPENDAAVKTAGAAEDVAAGGFAAIGGDNDAQVTFPVTVN